MQLTAQLGLVSNIGLEKYGFRQIKNANSPAQIHPQKFGLQKIIQVGFSVIIHITMIGKPDIEFLIEKAGC